MPSHESPTTVVLDPDNSLVYGGDVDRDLRITDRGRRKMVARGVLPPPDGYFGGRAFWRAATYERFKADLLAGKLGKPRRPGASVRMA
jgi:hypothetical protein